MNRLGFKTDDEIQLAMEILKNTENILIEGIYTHFSTADVDKTYYDIQLRRFRYVMKMIDYTFKSVHISNSSSVIKYENLVDFTTHARLGISLYGLTLDKNVNFLKNTFQLKTKISQIKHLRPGDKVGYGATYTAKDEEIIGILPIGYADGFIRKNQGGDVEINGKRYQIVGRICMDQMFIKIDENIMKTDDVILFGGIVSIDEVADRLDTINYEVICEITSRVPRKYIR
jgi:alanine racemase